MSLLDRFAASNERVKFYFQSSDGETEFLGLGIAEEFNNVPLKELTKILKQSRRKMRLFGGQRFNANSRADEEWEPFGSSYFFMPKVELISRRSSRQLPLNPHVFAHAPIDNAYTTLVRRAQEAIHRNEFEKAVIARRESLNIHVDFNCTERLCHYLKINPSKTKFAFQIDEEHCFFGASPEILYKRHGRLIESAAVAGTAQKDDSNLKTQKNLAEHAFVSNFIAERMKQLCVNVQQANTEFTQSSNLWHLKTQFSGTLQNTVDDDAIIDALHPTPALCGYPIQSSLEFISSNEHFDRGYYGGLIGYLSNKSSEMSVAIRSALRDKDQLHMYAGAGIIAASDPDAEYQETLCKMSPVRTFFLNQSGCSV